MQIPTLDSLAYASISIRMTECKNDVMMQFFDEMPQRTIYNIIFLYNNNSIHSSAATAIIEIIIIIDLLSLQQTTTTKWKKKKKAVGHATMGIA